MNHYMHFAISSLVMTLCSLASAADLPLPTQQDLSSQIGEFGFDRLLLVQRHPVEASHPYTFFYMDYRQGGGLFVYDLKSGECTKIVDSTDGEILTADLDFDARRIVFAWRWGEFARNEQKGYRPGKHAPVRLYTVNIDGSDLRQLTAGEDFNFDPCWLPDSTSSQKMATCCCATTRERWKYHCSNGTANWASTTLARSVADPDLPCYPRSCRREIRPGVGRLSLCRMSTKVWNRM